MVAFVRTMITKSVNKLILVTIQRMGNRGV
jgi:hypothetical protein